LSATARLLLDGDSGFGKAYLKLFVDEIRLDGKTDGIGMREMAGLVGYESRDAAGRALPLLDTANPPDSWNAYTRSCF